MELGSGEAGASMGSMVLVREGFASASEHCGTGRGHPPICLSDRSSGLQVPRPSMDMPMAS